MVISRNRNGLRAMGGDQVELLAPAATAASGILALNAGADAVYVGPPEFGARVRASNTFPEIERLARHAHIFGAKVYATLNTLLRDDELAAARDMAWSLYECGVDGLIVQDMAWAKMDLPPIPLHASTQTDNRTLERIQFLEHCGFERVVLARELSLKQIRELRAATSIGLEAFVHGALCVCYSGQCYLSEHLSPREAPRSANRGNCAQPCRMAYDVRTPSGEILARNQHVLSLRDLNQSENLEELLISGVRSLKIEGRLKDESYAQNVTAHYHRLLSRILPGLGLKRSSGGRTEYEFTPNPSLTFSRLPTTYLAHGRQRDLATLRSPKSMGEPLGKVTSVSGCAIEGEFPDHLENGDGFCFLGPEGLTGFRANSVDGGRIQSLDPVPGLLPGMILYRNRSQRLEREMRTHPASRTMHLAAKLHYEPGHELVLSLRDEFGLEIHHHLAGSWDLARDQGRAHDQWVQQLTKSSDPRVRIESVDLETNRLPFLPTSGINSMRRNALQAYIEATFVRPREEFSPLKPSPFPEGLATDFRLNVRNKLARDFYRDCGLALGDENQELEAAPSPELMRTKYCLRYELDSCPGRGAGAEPLILENRHAQLLASFDCKRCEMVITDLKGSRIKKNEYK